MSKEELNIPTIELANDRMQERVTVYYWEDLCQEFEGGENEKEKRQGCEGSKANG